MSRSTYRNELIVILDDGGELVLREKPVFMPAVGHHESSDARRRRGMGIACAVVEDQVVVVPHGALGFGDVTAIRFIAQIPEGVCCNLLPRSLPLLVCDTQPLNRILQFWRWSGPVYSREWGCRASLNRRIMCDDSSTDAGALLTVMVVIEQDELRGSQATAVPEFTSLRARQTL